MKIRKPAAEDLPKVYALLRSAFPDSEYEAALVQKLHEHDRPMHEWICIHSNRVVAYIAFTNAFHGKEVCGLHLAPMAVAPEFQKKGIGSELLRFALRQEAIKTVPLFVLGHPGYYQRFGFQPCSLPICPFDQNNAHFMCMRNDTNSEFVIGYEPEFKSVPAAKSRRGKRR